jgi:hypothetical protein
MSRHGLPAHRVVYKRRFLALSRQIAVSSKECGSTTGVPQVRFLERRAMTRLGSSPFLQYLINTAAGKKPDALTHSFSTGHKLTSKRLQYFPPLPIPRRPLHIIHHGKVK